MLLTDLEDSVALRIPLASPPLIQDAIREAVGVFCKQSTAWRRRYSSTRIVAAKADYDVSNLADAPVCAITDMRVKSTQAEIRSVTEAEMNRNHPGWQLATGKTIKRYLAPQRPDLIRLYPIPDTTDDFLDIELAMYPSANTTEIPDWIGEMYRDELVAGSCGVLYGLAGQPWSNAKAANAAEDRLIAIARNARVRVEKSHTRTPTFVQTTSFDEL